MKSNQTIVKQTLQKNQTAVDELKQLRLDLERESSELNAIQKREMQLLQEIYYYSDGSLAAGESQRYLEETNDANRKFANEVAEFNDLIAVNLKNRYREQTQLELAMRQSESEVRR